MPDVRPDDETALQIDHRAVAVAADHFAAIGDCHLRTGFGLIRRTVLSGLVPVSRPAVSLVPARPLVVATGLVAVSVPVAVPVPIAVPAGAAIIASLVRRSAGFRGGRAKFLIQFLAERADLVRGLAVALSLELVLHGRSGGLLRGGRGGLLLCRGLRALLVDPVPLPAAIAVAGRRLRRLLLISLLIILSRLIGLLGGRLIGLPRRLLSLLCRRLILLDRLLRLLVLSRRLLSTGVEVSAIVGVQFSLG